MTTKITFNKLGDGPSTSLTEMLDRHEVDYFEDTERAISPMFRASHNRKVLFLGTEEDYAIRTSPDLAEIKEHIERLYEDGLILWQYEEEFVDL